MDQKERRPRTASGRTTAERRVQRTGRPQGDDGRKQSSRRNQKRRRRRRLRIYAFLLVVLAVLGLMAAVLWKRYSPTKEKYDLKAYYGIQSEEQVAVTMDNQVVEPNAKVWDGKVYLQYETVRDYVNSRFYFDQGNNTLLYTLPKDIVSVEVGSKEYTISKEKKSEDYVILRTEGSTAYVALEFVQQYTNMDYEVYDNPSRVAVVTKWGKKTVASVKKDTQVRYQAGVKSPILTSVKKQDEVTVIETEGSWKKVRTKDGFIGYVKTSALRAPEEKTVSRKFEEPEFTSISKDYTINMAWHNVTNQDANSGVLQMIAKSKGLNTISPTWFHVSDTSGNINSIASAEYVGYAHQADVEVWAAVRDFDGGINSYEESLQLLKSTESRATLINQLISESLRVGVDGINVDFEKISEECGEHFIQFVRELSVRCRQNGLILSVDNYVPKTFNTYYNRKEQGIVADYVVIMGYDEHYAGSPEAGSVASYNFVKEGIEETLKEGVPANKIISGMPFFTRLWKETAKTKEELASQKGTEAAEYTMNVTSEALGMDSAQAVVDQSGAEVTWDETAKQDYATWSDGTTTYKIWLENDKSIEPRLQLMKDNKLAGTAAWALGQESESIWNLIFKYVN